MISPTTHEFADDNFHYNREKSPAVEAVAVVDSMFWHFLAVSAVIGLSARGVKKQ